jgi:hypothetical protein
MTEVLLVPSAERRRGCDGTPHRGERCFLVEDHFAVDDIDA